MEPNSPSRVGLAGIVFLPFSLFSFFVELIRFCTAHITKSGFSDTLFVFGSEEQADPVSCMFVDLISPLYVFGTFVDLGFFCIFQIRKMMIWELQINAELDFVFLRLTFSLSACSPSFVSVMLRFCLIMCDSECTGADLEF
ncbi:hypothetical protein HanXRQr2_Chr05g0199931 [Helianthus annuus]|uniref:Uncharacterized protein n=1 Tax=Helianthus annuus TaxID=4232 RepID=A0A251UPZ7_HELAN|nr:hypothetical protein HanXRQr2_Chr05g0199931 [Helianthus annuus]KAJ0921541.1 hypothetical protein HanPSC8_Chr05g0192761 [Helianthus annuus]